MKKAYSIILVFFISIQVNSQTYCKFPTSNALWNYKIVGSVFNPGDRHFIDSLGQPITIDNKKYIELYQGEKNRDVEIVGALREDTILKRIYFHDFYKEIKLYDFSLEVNDTINYNTNHGNYHKTVDSIDSIQVSGQYRKRMFLHNDGPELSDIWIEGIGSVYRYGLLYPVQPYIVMDATNPYFGCFKDKNTMYFEESNCNLKDCCPCDSWLVNIQEISNINTNINIYPNPADEYLTVEFTNDITPDTFIEIYSSKGMIIKKVKAINKINTLNIRDISQGVYFLKVGNQVFEINKN